MGRPRRSLVANLAASKIAKVAKAAGKGMRMKKVSKQGAPTKVFARQSPPERSAVITIPNPDYIPPPSQDQEHDKLISSINQSINLMDSVCGFLKTNVRKLCEAHRHESLNRDTFPRRIVPSSSDILANYNRVVQKNRLRNLGIRNGKTFDSVKRLKDFNRKSTTKVSSLKDVPPGFLRSDAIVVPLNESRKATFTTCEVPEVSDPEKGSRCFDYYRGPLPGSQDDEVSEYYIKNGKKLAAKREFKKITSETTDEVPPQVPDSTTEPME